MGSSDLGGAESLSSLAELCQYYCSPSAYTLQELHLFLAREYGHQVLWDHWWPWEAGQDQDKGPVC